MASQVPTLYCGRCGAPLAPGATFCGRCGTPVQLQAAAAPPVYRYPPPPQAGYRPAGRQRMAPVLIAVGLVVVVIIAAVGIGGFALSQFVGGSRSTCTSNCAPKVVAPLPEEATYRSSAYNFQVNYSSAWTVRSQDAHGVTLGTKLGLVSVVGTSGATPDQVLQSTINALPSSQFQDVTLVASLKGAHIGDQDGVGEIFSANLLGASQTATKVRFAVIAAARGGVTVAVFALNPADPKNSPNGMPEGQAFDYLCTEFTWG
ncbi:MAG: zinc ribbon domain-containing protein [Chloroflexi bacterium]|nr:MAG: zinc ribbon domain-containing protein [Chloroflexota bacterium]